MEGVAFAELEVPSRTDRAGGEVMGLDDGPLSPSSDRTCTASRDLALALHQRNERRRARQVQREEHRRKLLERSLSSAQGNANSNGKDAQLLNKSKHGRLALSRSWDSRTSMDSAAQGNQHLDSPGYQLGAEGQEASCATTGEASLNGVHEPFGALSVGTSLPLLPGIRGGPRSLKSSRRMERHPTDPAAAFNMPNVHQTDGMSPSDRSKILSAFSQLLQRGSRSQRTTRHKHPGIDLRMQSASDPLLALRHGSGSTWSAGATSSLSRGQALLHPGLTPAGDNRQAKSTVVGASERAHRRTKTILPVEEPDSGFDGFAFRSILLEVSRQRTSTGTSTVQDQQSCPDSGACPLGSSVEGLSTATSTIECPLKTADSGFQQDRLCQSRQESVSVQLALQSRRAETAGQMKSSASSLLVCHNEEDCSRLSFSEWRSSEASGSSPKRTVGALKTEGQKPRRDVHREQEADIGDVMELRSLSFSEWRSAPVGQAV